MASVWACVWKFLDTNSSAAYGRKPVFHHSSFFANGRDSLFFGKTFRFKFHILLVWRFPLWFESDLKLLKTLFRFFSETNSETWDSNSSILKFISSFSLSLLVFNFWIKFLLFSNNVDVSVTFTLELCLIFLNDWQQIPLNVLNQFSACLLKFPAFRNQSLSFCVLFVIFRNFSWHSRFLKLNNSILLSSANLC